MIEALAAISGLRHEGSGARPPSLRPLSSPRGRHRREDGRVQCRVWRAAAPAPVPDSRSAGANGSASPLFRWRWSRRRAGLTTEQIAEWRATSRDAWRNRLLRADVTGADRRAADQYGSTAPRSPCRFCALKSAAGGAHLRRLMRDGGQRKGSRLQPRTLGGQSRRLTRRWLERRDPRRTAISPYRHHASRGSVSRHWRHRG